MTYTILSAQYANEDHTAAVIQTHEAGAVVASEADTPDLWASMLAAAEPAAYVELPALPAITYKADIWRRATAEEAEVIDNQISAQPVRERNLFRDALYLSHDDPFFADLRAGFVLAFGPERAGELLAPSE